MTGWILESTGEPAQTLRIAAGSVKTLGRTTRADFIVKATLVSRLHCKLIADSKGQLIVEDLGSTNGTAVNGKTVQRAELKEGDRLTVGRMEFVVKHAE